MAGNGDDEFGACAAGASRVEPPTATANPAASVKRGITPGGLWLLSTAWVWSADPLYQPMEPVTVGLLPTVDCGTGCGPCACCSSESPMH
jgi:hypothetical protein